MKYDNNKTLIENATNGVDITEPNLPIDLDLTDEDDYKLPDQVYDSIDEYLSDKYGYCPSGYGLTIKIESIDWDVEE